MNPRTVKLCRVILVLLLFVPLIASAQDEKFQAIFLYKFIDNVNWPDAKRDLRIGILGSSDVLDEFNKILKAICQ